MQGHFSSIQIFATCRLWSARLLCQGGGFSRQEYWCVLANTGCHSLLLLLLLSRFSCVQLCVTPETAAHQAPRPWVSPGKSTGVGCHFLLQCMKVKTESEVTQSCPTLSNPMDCSLPVSSVHGIFQARVLEWGAIAFSRVNLGCYFTMEARTMERRGSSGGTNSKGY